MRELRKCLSTRTSSSFASNPSGDTQIRTVIFGPTWTTYFGQCEATVHTASDKPIRSTLDLQQQLCLARLTKQRLSARVVYTSFSCCCLVRSAHCTEIEQAVIYTGTYVRTSLQLVVLAVIITVVGVASYPSYQDLLP